jgi:hypothetical protein
MVCGWFGLKTTRTVFADLASKPVARLSSDLASKPVVTVFFQFGLKTGGDGFSRFGIKTSSRFFFVEPQNQGGGGFPGLGLKTGSSGLVIWASKSPRRFLCLGLKTKWASVCRLRHKINGGRSVRDTRRDLAASLA